MRALIDEQDIVAVLQRLRKSAAEIAHARAAIAVKQNLHRRARRGFIIAPAQRQPVGRLRFNRLKRDRRRRIDHGEHSFTQGRILFAPGNAPGIERFGAPHDEREPVQKVRKRQYRRGRDQRNSDGYANWLHLGSLRRMRAVPAMEILAQQRIARRGDRNAHDHAGNAPEAAADRDRAGTDACVARMLALRGPSEQAGFVLKGVSTLFWPTFRKQTGPFVMGEASEERIQTRLREIRPLIRQEQAACLARVP